MKTIGIIPARYASSRFPGKPLIDIAGQSMIQRVYNQAKLASSLDEVIVATDDQVIYEHVAQFGGKAIMTKETHQSGTDRCAEVMEQIHGFEIAINIQGDEPFIDPEQINLLRNCFNDANTQIATLVREIKDTEELFNENRPKVVVNKNQEALYFSRQTVPFQRGVNKEKWLSQHSYYSHIGIYGYRSNILQELAALPYSTLEDMEALEQLRWLDNGFRIKTAVSNHLTEAIDTPEDLAYLLRKYFNN